MSLLDGIRHRVYVALRGERYAREVERELRFHLDLDALARHPESAAQEEREIPPRQSLGNVTYYREEVRRMTTLHWLDRLHQDAAYAWRGLKQSPGFTLMVVVTLALGIGVNTAMFSLLDDLFVQPPAGIAAPREIVRLYEEFSRPHEPGGRLAFDSFRYADYRAIRAADSSLRIALFTQPDSTAVVQGETRIPARRSVVTADYFGLLGVRPQRGRFFTGDEDRIESATPVAVLSDAFWRTAFGADTGILGKTIVLDTKPFTVIGVAPKDFTGVDLDAVDVWAPANTYESSGFRGEPWYETFQNSFRAIARAPRGLDRQRLSTIGTAAIRSVHLRGFEYDSTATVLTGSIVRAIGPAKRAQELSISTRLAGVSGVVLLIACANVANLLLVRAARRQREIAVRRALGVSTARLVQQMLTESLLLSALGGASAVLFAFWAGNALRRLMLPSTHWAGSAVDLRTIAFAGAVVLFVGVIAGLAPALQATRPDLVNSLKAGSREGSYRRSRLRSALLVAQATLSVVLLVGAGLFVESLHRIRGVDLGYDVEHTLFVRPTFATPPPATEIASGLRAVAERLREAPGVEAVALASSAPMSGYSVTRLFLPDRDSLPKFDGERGAYFLSVSPGYFGAARIRLVAGRDFVESDAVPAPRAVVVSRMMGRTYWPGENPIGKCLIIGERTNPCSIVVGIADDVHRMSVVERPALQYYLPLGQNTRDARDLIIRTSEREMPAVGRLAAQELTRTFSRRSIPRIRSMNCALEPQFRPWQLGATLFTAFGALAVVVAAIGVYSVVAYAVSQRTHEVGIRLALGARLTDVLRLVLGETSGAIAVGIATGIVAALALGRWVASLLYDVSARDPLVITGAAGLLFAIGLVASLIPGWRAARVDPSTALRAD